MHTVNKKKKISSTFQNKDEKHYKRINETLEDETKKSHTMIYLC